MKDEKLLVNYFIKGLNVEIVGPICMATLGSLQVAMEKGLINRGDSG